MPIKSLRHILAGTRACRVALGVRFTWKVPLVTVRRPVATVGLVIVETSKPVVDEVVEAVKAGR
jgi:hypothetical protein